MPAPKKQQTEQPDPARAYVDELGIIERELAPFQTKIARAEMLRKAIRESRADAAPGQAIQIEADRFIAALGARANQTVIDFPALVKRITAKAFANFGTCSLKALAENTDAATVAAVTSTTQTGPRSLKILPKGVA